MHQGIIGTWIITKVGEKAGIVVARHGRKPKYASLHDLRRTFAQDCFDRRYPLAHVQDLMRHTLTTTLAYYASTRKQQIADEIWKLEESGNRVTS